MSVAAALLGSEGALAEFDEATRGRLERTRDRLARLPAEISPTLAAAAPEYRELILTRGMELALIELFPSGPPTGGEPA